MTLQRQMGEDQLVTASGVDLDRDDPLATYRERFVLDGDVVAYLDGNSLGRLPIATRDRLADFVAREWGQDLIRGWERWVHLPTEVGDELAPLIGAAVGQTVIADSTSVCLYKVLHTAAGLRPDRTELIVEAHAFPTDRYLVESVAQAHGWTVTLLKHVADLADAVNERTAAVVLGHVDYRTGELHDLHAVTAQIQTVGALAIWDLCHSVGVVPVTLDDAEVDLAVGCTYKYLNAGPGAPAFLYVASRHLDSATQPISGWWSTADMFAMENAYDPAPSIRRMLSGTPPVMGILSVREGVRMVADAGVDAIRAKSLALTDFAIDLLEAANLEVVAPRDRQQRGGQVSVRHPKARQITDELVSRGVVPDLRQPDLVRLGFSPLTTSFAEVEDGLGALIEVTRALDSVVG